MAGQAGAAVPAEGLALEQAPAGGDAVLVESLIPLLVALALLAQLDLATSLAGDRSRHDRRKHQYGYRTETMSRLHERTSKLYSLGGDCNRVLQSPYLLTGDKRSPAAFPTGLEAELA